MDEEWRDVVGFEGLYQVSNLGRVKRIQKSSGTPGGILSPGVQNGYPTVTLCNGSRHKYSKIHRLVIEAFVGPIPKGMQAHHKNGNRADNCLENLEILTVSEHQSREHVLRCAKLEPIGRGGGITMFDHSRGYTR